MSEQSTTAIDINTVVSHDPEVHSGDLVFAGTRVPVDRLTNYLSYGPPLSEFLENFPTVEKWQADAYLKLSVEAIDHMRMRGSGSA